ALRVFLSLPVRCLRSCFVSFLARVLLPALRAFVSFLTSVLVRVLALENARVALRWRFLAFFTAWRASSHVDACAAAAWSVLSTRIVVARDSGGTAPAGDDANKPTVRRAVARTATHRRTTAAALFT